MIIQTAGEIIPGLHALGNIDLPSFLLEGEHPVLIDAGMTGMGPRYVTQARDVLNGCDPEYLFLTHSHYDHCGGVAELRKAFGGMRVCSAEAGAEILKRPKAIETIRELNRAGAAHVARQHGDMGEIPDFEVFAVDRVVSNGDTVPLGNGITLEAIATPGHTRDSMSYYVPEKRILFTGEAVGIMSTGGYIYSEWLTDYEQYLASMKKLEKLEIDILCTGHGMVLTGEDAAGFISRSIQYCVSFRRLIEMLLAMMDNDIEEIKQRIKKTEYDPMPEPKQPEIAYLINLDSKIRAIQKLKQQTAGD